jgi:hypothetical protein
MSYTTPNLLTDESRMLAQLARLQRMTIHRTITDQVSSSAVFVIGDGGASTPANGTTTYTNVALKHTTPQVFLDGTGLLTLGTDYSFNSTTGVITLLLTTFNTSDRYIILY